MKSLNLFVSAGEASGDQHAADVVSSLKELAANEFELYVWGMGGPKLKEAETDLIQDSSKLGVMGVADVLKQLPFFLTLEKRLVEEIRKRKPDIALLVDYPGLNLRLAEAIRKYVPSCKIVYYIAPQVWAWGHERLKKIPLLVDRLFPILPFEEKLFKDNGVSAKYVGNPSAYVIGQIDEQLDKQAFIEYCGADPSRPVIGVFPGSRKREIEYMLPVLLDSMKLLASQRPEVQFILVKAPTIDRRLIDDYILAAGVPLDNLFVQEGNFNHFVLESVHIAWLTSGTVTLEAACAETPMILGYKENPIFFQGYTMLRRIDKIGLPNIVAGEDVCPELLQGDCIPEKWVGITKQWLDNPQMLEEISFNLKTKVKDKLSVELDPAVHVAQEIVMIHNINHLSMENLMHMREQAHQNSQQTKKEISEDPLLQLKKK
jgi:lipid-A-disaccharide synthase